MTKVERTVEVNAPPERVWSIISDPQSYPKLQSVITTVEATPAGLVSVGQKIHRAGKLRGKRVETFREVAEVEPMKKMRATLTSGGIYEKGEETFTLEPTEKGTTKVNWRLDFNLAMGVLGKGITTSFLEKAIRKANDEYFRNLRLFAELRRK